MLLPDGCVLAAVSRCDQRLEKNRSMIGRSFGLARRSGIFLDDRRDSDRTLERQGTVALRKTKEGMKK